MFEMNFDVLRFQQVSYVCQKIWLRPVSMLAGRWVYLTPYLTLKSHVSKHTISYLSHTSPNTWWKWFHIQFGLIELRGLIIQWYFCTADKWWSPAPLGYKHPS